MGRSWPQTNTGLCTEFEPSAHGDTPVTGMDTTVVAADESAIRVLGLTPRVQCCHNLEGALSRAYDLTERKAMNPPDENPRVDALEEYVPAPGTVTVFSAPWCRFCTGLKSELDASGITFREVLIEEDPEAERIAADANGGDWIIPTVLFPDGSIEINPSREDVSQRLAELSQT